MQFVDYIVKADYVLTANSNMDVLHNSAVVINDGAIIDVIDSDKIGILYKGKKLIECDVVMPGFVNCHCHAAMVYFRGIADDIPLAEWLQNYIWPLEAKWLSPEFVSDAVYLASAEMLKSGITTVADLYFFADINANVYKDIGMRAVVCSGVIDFPTKSGNCVDDYLKNAELLYQNWHSDKLIIPSIVAHSQYACSKETLGLVREFADAYKITPHIHISETLWEVQECISKNHCRPVQYLDSIGFLQGGTVAAHCIHVDEDELRLIFENNVKIVHCIDSNLKLASGFAPITKMIDKGICVALGTDGAASNNDLDILAEASLTARLHKALNSDPTVIDAKTAFAMATIKGAEVLGISHLTGSIEVGKRADIITASLDNIHLLPMYDIYSHIIYSMHSSDIIDVMIDGKLLMSSQCLINMDEGHIKQKARDWNKKILQGVSYGK